MTVHGWPHCRRGRAIRERRFANSPILVRAVGLGCNSLGSVIDTTQSEAVIRTALDEGINFFDTADIYGDGRSEEVLGKALTGRRGEAVIATKFGMPREDTPGSGGASRRFILNAVDASLRRLRTDYIDLYQLHQPDPHIPIDETAGVLADLVRQGKIRFIGVCNVSAEVLDVYRDALNRLRRGAFISVQVQYSLLRRGAERELLPWCETHGLGLLPYFPLASGLLTGKYRFGRRPPEGSRIARWGAAGERILNSAEMKFIEQLGAWASQRQRSILELAIGWLLRCDAVPCVIAGATSPAQVRANCAAADWVLAEGECLELRARLEEHERAAPASTS